MDWRKLDGDKLWGLSSTCRRTAAHWSTLGKVHQVHPKDFHIFQAPMHPFIALITHRSPTFIFTPKSCRKTLHHALKASACQYFACCFSAAMKSPLRPSRAARTSSLARSTSSTSTAATAPGCCSAGSAGLAASLRRSRSSMARAVEGLEAS